MKILVTGGAGFIGHNVVLRLQDEGHDVHALDNLTTYGVTPQPIHEALIDERTTDFVNPIQKYHIASFEAKQFIKDLNPDTIIHLASFPRAKIVNADPKHGAYTMVDGLFNLLSGAVSCDLTRFLYVSSSMVYGNFSGGIREDAECKPGSIYASFKLAGEQIVKEYASKSDFDYTIVRPSAVYGPRDVEDRVVSKLLLNAMRGEPMNVNGFHERLDFSYVDDVADGIVKAATYEDGANETFNITRGGDRSILEAAEIVKELVGSGDIKINPKDPKMPSRGYLSIDKARNVLGYAPSTDIEEGFKIYYDWLSNSVLWR